MVEHRKRRAIDTPHPELPMSQEELEYWVKKLSEAKPKYPKGDDESLVDKFRHTVCTHCSDHERSMRLNQPPTGNESR